MMTRRGGSTNYSVVVDCPLYRILAVARCTSLAACFPSRMLNQRTKGAMLCELCFAKQPGSVATCRGPYLSRSVIDDEIHDQLHVTSLQLIDQAVNIGHCTERRMDVIIVRLIQRSKHVLPSGILRDVRYRIPYPSVGFCKLMVNH